MSELTLREFNNGLRLRDAMVCLNCEAIHRGYTCPRCGKGPSYHVSNWIKPIEADHLRDNYQRAQGEG